MTDLAPHSELFRPVQLGALTLPNRILMRRSRATARRTTARPATSSSSIIGSATFYGGDERGYTDYPFLTEQPRLRVVG